MGFVISIWPTIWENLQASVVNVFGLFCQWKYHRQWRWYTTCRADCGIPADSNGFRIILLGCFWRRVSAEVCGQNERVKHITKTIVAREEEPQRLCIERVFTPHIGLKLEVYTTDGLRLRASTKSRDFVVCLSEMVLGSKFKYPGWMWDWPRGHQCEPYMVTFENQSDVNCLSRCFVSCVILWSSLTKTVNKFSRALVMHECCAKLSLVNSVKFGLGGTNSFSSHWLSKSNFVPATQRNWVSRVHVTRPGSLQSVIHIPQTSSVRFFAPCTGTSIQVCAKYRLVTFSANGDSLWESAIYR